LPAIIAEAERGAESFAHYGLRGEKFASPAAQSMAKSGCFQGVIPISRLALLLLNKE
jgi:hypothetical protein